VPPPDQQELPIGRGRPHSEETSPEAVEVFDENVGRQIDRPVLLGKPLRKRRLQGAEVGAMRGLSELAERKSGPKRVESLAVGAEP